MYKSLSKQMCVSLDLYLSRLRWIKIADFLVLTRTYSEHSIYFSSKSISHNIFLYEHFPFAINISQVMYLQRYNIEKEGLCQMPCHAWHHVLIPFLQWFMIDALTHLKGSQGYAWRNSWSENTFTFDIQIHAHEESSQMMSEKL